MVWENGYKEADVKTLRVVTPCTLWPVHLPFFFCFVCFFAWSCQGVSHSTFFIGSRHNRKCVCVCAKLEYFCWFSLIESLFLDGEGWVISAFSGVQVRSPLYQVVWFCALAFGYSRSVNGNTAHEFHLAAHDAHVFIEMGHRGTDSELCNFQLVPLQYLSTTLTASACVSVCLLMSFCLLPLSCSSMLGQSCHDGMRDCSPTNEIIVVLCVSHSDTETNC